MKFSPDRRILSGLLCAGVLVVGGCGVPPMAVMSQSQMLHRAGAEVRNAAAEWAADVQAGDDAREAAAIGAFVARIRRAADNEPQIATDTAAFTSALTSLRRDRYAADERLRVVLDNVDAVDEAADAMQQLAVESQSLNDEWKRYVTDNLAAMKAAQQDAAAQRAAQRTARQQKRAEIVGQLLSAAPVRSVLPAPVAEAIERAVTPTVK